MQSTYCVYILTNEHNKVLYVGRTENLAKRVYEHKHKCAEGFTKKYNISKLVYYELYEDKDAAAEREYRIKRWRRAWKDQLIAERNPQWQDLYESICG
ncbi:MAG: GIY-YIG nuclease family protein [Alphaproteobacteria bacterium]|nr:GIY-YIG nuclease family protein [Alphaproteobacteria bacterium]